MYVCKLLYSVYTNPYVTLALPVTINHILRLYYRVVLILFPCVSFWCNIIIVLHTFKRTAIYLDIFSHRTIHFYNLRLFY